MAKNTLLFASSFANFRIFIIFKN